jgi:hypothetical protein
MTYSAPEPVVSGIPYRVTTVGGSPVSSLDEFVGTVEIEIDKHGSPYLIDGEGRVRDDAVRVHEKNGKGGKDVRVWRIYVAPEGFVAETV